MNENVNAWNCWCRAPVMVALALIELGLPYEDAVEMIRK